MRISKIRSLSSFQIYNTVLLTTVAMLYLAPPEMRGWEMFPGVASSCKSTHLLYLRHCSGCQYYKDNSDRDPAPSRIVGGKESKEQDYTVGDGPRDRCRHVQGGGSEFTGLTHPWWT